MCIAIKRVYDPIGDDGMRILVYRLWPRGVSKDNLQGACIKDVARALRCKWFDHQPDQWLEFKRRYFAELATRQESVEKIVELVQNGRVTLLYSSKNNDYNHAIALLEYLQKFLKNIYS